MIRHAIAGVGLAAALLPAAALAQPYYSYDPPTPYHGEDGGVKSAQDYGRDTSAYVDDNDRSYDAGRQHFTGRVGASWRDADGRLCRWREVTREESDGYQSFKWVTVCRD
jgi:hypothetical protein